MTEKHPSPTIKFTKESTRCVVLSYNFFFICIIMLTKLMEYTVEFYCYELMICIDLVCIESIIKSCSNEQNVLFA